MVEAEKVLRAASNIVAVVPETEFLLAKVLMHKGDAEEAKEPLLKAISEESFFCFRAASDADFKNHLPKVRLWFKEKKTQTLDELNQWRNESLQLKTLHEIFHTVSGSNTQSDRLMHLEKSMEVIDEKTYLSDLLDFRKQEPILIEIRNDFIVKQSDAVEAEVAEVMRALPTTRVPSVQVRHDKEAGFMGGASGMLVGAGIGAVIAIILTANEATGQGYIGGTFTWIFGLLIYGFMGVVGGGLAGIIVGWLFGKVSETSRVEREKAENERVRKKAQDALFQEETRISQDKAAVAAKKSKFDILLQKLNFSG
ncbi:hypothetical protein DQW77_17440 [Roseovarius sp. TE539]|nr:hypothetical protein DQW77_17440 [Roseovarius sp. TE539]